MDETDADVSVTVPGVRRQTPAALDSHSLIDNNSHFNEGRTPKAAKFVLA